MRYLLFSVLLTGLLFLSVGCNVSQVETMDLLDEKISEVKISKSKGFGGMNENFTLSINDKQAVQSIGEVITSAMKKDKNLNLGEPEFDVMVVYDAEDGELPTHGIHLWLGEENEESVLMYIGDETFYMTTPKNTNKFRSSVLSSS